MYRMHLYLTIHFHSFLLFGLLYLKILSVGKFYARRLSFALKMYTAAQAKHFIPRFMYKALRKWRNFFSRFRSVA